MKGASVGVFLGGAALLLFGLWCGALAWDVAQLRGSVETHVGWLIELQTVQADAADAGSADTAERLAVLVEEARGSAVEDQLVAVQDAWRSAASLPPAERAADLTTTIDGAVRSVRRQTGTLSGQLGQLWDSLNALVFAALVLGAIALRFYHLAVRRRRKAEELGRALERAQTRRTQLLARISHDLRTPLSAIFIAQELLAEDSQAAEVEETEDLLRIVRHGAEALNVLVDDVQALTRLEAGAIELRMEPFSVGALADRCVEIAAALAHGRDLRIVQSVERGLPDRWLGDSDRIRQILLNLLSNAIKFSGEGDVVLAVAHLPAGGLLFRVADSGRGIAPDELARAFEPWQRVGDEAKQRSVQGSGLGLSICRELAERMGGRVALKSELGVGTEFTVELPLVPLPEPTEPGLEAIEAELPAARHRH